MISAYMNARLVAIVVKSQSHRGSVGTAAGAMFSTSDNAFTETSLKIFGLLFDFFARRGSQLQVPRYPLFVWLSF